MSIPELLDSILDYKLELVIWVLVSILVYGIAVNLWCRLRRSPSSRVGQRLRTFESWPHSLWLFQVLRLVYYLGVPYLALTRGVSNPTLMGMWAPDWFEERWFGELASGLVLGLGAFLLLLWGWRHCLLATGKNDGRHASEPYLFQRSLLAAPWGWGLVVLEVLYLEMHWAFYRSATIRVAGEYYGVFLGFLLVLAEWCLNPAIRNDMGVTTRGGETLTTATIAFSVGVIYYFTANLWLCLAVHLIMQFGLLSLLNLSSGLPYYEGESH
jgi:hypothetical protein